METATHLISYHMRCHSNPTVLERSTVSKLAGFGSDNPENLDKPEKLEYPKDLENQKTEEFPKNAECHTTWDPDNLEN